MSTGNQNVATDQLREHGAQWGSGAVSCDELTTLDDHELRDIGLTRACLRNEPNGPLWTLAISGGLIPPRLSAARIVQSPIETR
jgi:uncharacterized protein YjiS (DUF1127 family)